VRFGFPSARRASKALLVAISDNKGSSVRTPMSFASCDSFRSLSAAAGVGVVELMARTVCHDDRVQVITSSHEASPGSAELDAPAGVVCEVSG
jgi:hypothetical protein